MSSKGMTKSTTKILECFFFMDGTKIGDSGSRRLSRIDSCLKGNEIFGVEVYMPCSHAVQQSNWVSSWCFRFLISEGVIFLLINTLKNTILKDPR